MAKTKPETETETKPETKPETDTETLNDTAPPAPDALPDYRVLSRLIHSGVTYEPGKTVALTPEKAQKLIELGVVVETEAPLAP